MNRLLKKNYFIFAVDAITSTAASVISILAFRLLLTEIPGYSQHVLIWAALSFAASNIAVFFSKTYKILFQYASFKAIFNIVVCAVIKELLLIIPLMLIEPVRVNSPFILIILDICITLIAIIFLKIIPLFYKEEEEEEEERAVDCLNIAIFGTSPKSIAAITRYQNSKRYRVTAIVTKDKLMAGKIIMDIPVIYCPDDISNFQPKDVEAVLFPKIEELQAESDNLVKQLTDKGICIMTLPPAKSANYPGMEYNQIKHIMENQFIPDNMSGFSRSLKRIIDFTISSVLIVLLAIPMLVIYIVLKVTEGSPVIFKQERIGRFGRPFIIYKFRTMRLDAESDGPALYGGDDDPRLTRVGKFLRVHHLDELPQLFNVWLGDMSFVGYRPERKVYIDKITEKDPRYSYLYQIRPGVTSYATLRNGYTDSLEKMLRRLQFDLYYLNHRSFFLDIKILWDTFVNMAIGKKF